MPNNDLISACARGDIAKIERLLKNGADPCADNGIGLIPFLYAAEIGFTDALKLFVQYGADPEISVREEYYITPRMNSKDGWNALFFAVFNGHHDTAYYLLNELKLDPNQSDVWDVTPIMLAAKKGDIQMLQLLLQFGANPYAVSRLDHQNALQYAIAEKRHNIIKYFMTHFQFDPNTQGIGGDTPLALAIESGDIEFIDFLIQSGANFNTVGPLGITALHYAVIYDKRDVARHLITQSNFDPNSKDKKGASPFMLAALNGDIKMLCLLIELGANPYATDDKGRNALHYVAKGRRPDIAQYLITHLNFDPNAQDKNGTTPLMIAAEEGDHDMFECLIQLGTNPYLTDFCGRNTLHYAIESHHLDLIQHLIIRMDFDLNSQDHQGTTPFMLAAQRGDINILRYLIQLGANPYAIDHQGRNALHYAAEYKNSKAASFLISYLHIDPNEQDRQGNTPLHIALQKEDDKFTKILVQLGLQQHVRPHSATPSSNDEFAKTLIQLGTNPNTPNHQGETSTSIAYERGIQLEKRKPSTITL